MRRTTTYRGLVAGVAVVLVTAGATAAAEPPSPGAASPGAASPAWRLVYNEPFGRPLPVQAANWVKDPHGDASPWNVDHLDDDGRLFQVQGGPEFQRQLDGFDVLRKRVPFGRDGWLTAELAARDADSDGEPDAGPSLTNVTMGKDDVAARLDEPSHDGGIIIRNTRPLPRRYRVEYTLRTLDFGGKRNGSWSYDGRLNGYATTGCKTPWPWKASGDFSGPADACNPNFGDIRDQNGYYFLAITDYPNPAPHNNTFIHNHRKVGMDSYAVNRANATAYEICNPATKQTYDYNSAQSSNNGINEIFMDGSRWRNPSIGYVAYIMPTECGTFDGTVSGKSIVAAADMIPELMPDQPYRFAIERDGTGYTMEMSGNFREAGPMTLRYRRDFVQDGKPIWHYNQTPEEYDGAFDSTLTFTGPYGSYQVEQWPKGSAYPDHFLLGDPHMNFYEGSATIDDLRMYVPAR